MDSNSRPMLPEKLKPRGKPQEIVYFSDNSNHPVMDNGMAFWRINSVWEDHLTVEETYVGTQTYKPNLIYWEIPDKMYLQGTKREPIKLYYATLQEVMEQYWWMLIDPNARITSKPGTTYVWIPYPAPV